jgi:hypothetical protein
VRIYLREIGRGPLLTAEDKVEPAKAIQRAKLMAGSPDHLIASMFVKDWRGVSSSG